MALFLICSLIKNKIWRILFSLLSSLFICLHLMSLFVTQSFVGYQFYVHSNLRGITGMTGMFIPHLIGISFIFSFLVILNFYSFKLSNTITKAIKKEVSIFSKKAITIGLSSLLVSLVLLISTFIEDSKTLKPIFFMSNSDFQEVLVRNKMNDYITPENIESSKGKNIIILSLESLEKAFLTEKYSALTPNLNKLKKEWNYFDLEQNLGSEWTSGSLYTYLTGFPAFFGVGANDIFGNSHYSDISSVSHVLKKANYTTTYLNGNTDFSGTIDILNTLQFDKIIDDKSVPKSGFESMYGLRDKDLFELAKMEIDNNQDVNQPFALFISTTDTHFPNGYYDSRMESVISEKDSDLEFMVAALDYMIGDFISYLERENLLENTIVYIFPDHLKMGSPVIFKGTGKRGLYLITNSNELSNYHKQTETLYQIDLPKMILQGAQINHNLKFLSDYIKGNKNEYIKDNIQLLTEINTSGIHRAGEKTIRSIEVSKNYLDYKIDNSRFIAQSGGKINGYVYTNSREALDYNYENGFRMFELDILQTIDGEYVAAHDWKHWSGITNYDGELSPSKIDFMNTKIYGEFSPLDMDGINEWFSSHKDAILITDKVNDPIRFSKEFMFKDRLMMKLFDYNSLQDGVRSGILSAMPSQFILNEITAEKIKSLAKNGVKDIAISRGFIKGNKNILKEFKNNNIRVYMDNVNTITGIREEYVVKYEMDFIHGIFADEWSFDLR